MKCCVMPLNYNDALDEDQEAFPEGMEMSQIVAWMALPNTYSKVYLPTNRCDLSL